MGAQPTTPFTTFRDFVSDDTFFKNTLEDFDKMREGMFSESRDMWKRFDQDFRTRTSRSDNMRESSQKTTSSVRNWSQTGRKESSNENVDMMNNNHQPRWGMVGCYLLGIQEAWTVLRPRMMIPRWKSVLILPNTDL